MACGPFFSSPRSIRLHLHGRTVQRPGFDLETDDLSLRQLRENPIQYAAVGPAVHAGVDRVPVAEAREQAAPVAALLGHVHDRVQHAQIGPAHVATRGWQTMRDQAVLCVGDFQVRSSAHITRLGLTRPSFFAVRIGNQM